MKQDKPKAEPRRKPTTIHGHTILAGLIICGLLLAAMPTVAQEAAPSAVSVPTQADSLPAKPGSPALRIFAGDLLQVDVFDTPELSCRVRVSEKGDILMPVAGTLAVAGLTAHEASIAVEKLLAGADVLKHPKVSVFIQEYATQGVSVLGEVKNPGVYPLLGEHGLLDFISMAGGVTPTAAKQVSIIHKGAAGSPETVQLENGPEVAMKAVMTILPGDTIMVARSGIVYVIGDVAKPGGFLIEHNDRLTMLQALALAQGVNRTAGLKNTRLLRKTAAGRTELSVNLKAVLAGKRDDVPLEDGDVLFVPSSKGKLFTYRGLEAAVGMATGVVIYHR